MSEEGSVREVMADDDFSDRRGRSRFSTKVLLAVFFQFSVLVAYCNGFVYNESLSNWIAGALEANWWVILVAFVCVILAILVFFFKPQLLTEAPKCYVSFIVLTNIIGAFTGFLAVYVSASMCNPKTDPLCNEAQKLAATQIISSALYGTLICLLICVALNWLMDMENQFKLMLIIQLILTIPCGFLMWWILGWQIAYVAAICAFICGVMTWIMFFLRMIMFADFLQEAADDMGADTIDNLWIFAACLLYVQICRLFLAIVRLLQAASD